MSIINNEFNRNSIFYNVWKKNEVDSPAPDKNIWIYKRADKVDGLDTWVNKYEYVYEWLILVITTTFLSVEYKL